MAPVHERPTLPNPLRDCEFSDLALRRVDVARAPATAAGVQRKRAVADVHVAGAAPFVRGGTEIEGEVAAWHR